MLGFHIFFLAVSYPFLVRASLLCNGDFEAYAQYVAPSSTDPYAFIASNTSCWYNQNLQIFQVKKPISPSVTIVSELVSNVSYTICQNLILNPLSDYTLIFTILNPKGITSSTVTVYLNTTTLIQVTVKNQKTILIISKNFTSNSTAYALCFKPKSYSKTLFNTDLSGPCIDNITLLGPLSPSPIINSTMPNITNSTNQSDPLSSTAFSNSTNSTNSTNLLNTIGINSSNNISNTSSTPNQENESHSNVSSVNSTQKLTFLIRQFQIFCTSKALEVEWKIIYTCTYQFGGFIIKNAIKSNFTIIFQGEVQYNFKFIRLEEDIFIVDVYPDREYDLSTVQIVIPQAKTIDEEAKFLIFIDGKRVFFNLLSLQQAETIKRISPITQIFADKTKEVYQVLRSTFCSFFLTNLISFWNLSLMYNFLNIQTIPQFSKITLEKLAIIVFKIDSISQFLIKSMKVEENIFDFSSTITNQKMKTYHNTYAWFGFMGMSSGAINNNFQFFLIMLFLTTKLSVIYLINKFCNKEGKIKSLKKVNYQIIFLKQYLGNVPIILISAGTDILDMYYLRGKDKINTFLQLVLLISCVVAYILFYLCRSKSYSDRKGGKKQMKKFYIILEIVLYFTIPILIIMDFPSIFLIVNSTVIGYRCIWVIRNRANFRIRDKIFKFLLNMVWVSHHAAYCAFYVFHLVKKNRQLTKGEQDFLVYCGIASIFTVLSGAALQALSLAMKMIMSLYKLIKKYCHKKITPMNQNKQQIGLKKPVQPKKINKIIRINNSQKDNDIDMERMERQKEKERDRDREGDRDKEKHEEKAQKIIKQISNAKIKGKVKLCREQRKQNKNALKIKIVRASKYRKIFGKRRKSMSKIYKKEGMLQND